MSRRGQRRLAPAKTKDASRKARIKNWTSLGALATIYCGLLSWALLPGTGANPQPRTADSKLPLCPVGGMPINFAVRLPADDGPIFFCCKHCIEKYNADPAQYATQVEAERVALKALPRVQVSCPVSGEPVKVEFAIQHNDETIYFRSEAYRVSFQEAPDRYRAKLAASYSYQTRCPVSGKPIDPRFSTHLAEGTTIYFCSQVCLDAFLRDPHAYADKLVEQGMRVFP